MAVAKIGFEPRPQGVGESRSPGVRPPSRKPRSVVVSDYVVRGRLLVVRGRQLGAAAAIAQKLIEGSLNPLLYGIRTAVAHPGMLKFCTDDIDAVRLGLLRGRQYTGIGLKIRIRRAE